MQKRISDLFPSEWVGAQELDLSDEKVFACCFDLFTKSNQFKEECPTLSKLLSETQNSNFTAEGRHGFVNNASIIDIGYNFNREYAFTAANVCLTSSGYPVFYTISLYDGLITAPEHRIGFEENTVTGKSFFTLDCKSTNFKILLGDLDHCLTAEITVYWYDEIEKKLRIIYGRDRKPITITAHGHTKDVVVSVDVSHPRNIITKAPNPIMVGYQRYDPRRLDYFFPHAIIDPQNRQKVYMHVYGVVRLSSDSIIEKITRDELLLQCESFGTVKCESKMNYRLNGNNFILELPEGDWNNYIQESVQFGEQVVSFLLQIHFTCIDDPGTYRVIISSEEVGDLVGVPHYKQIPYINILWGCLAENTLIDMADGSKKAINQIQVGDKVFTQNGEIDEVCNITSGYESTIYNLKTNGGHEIQSTYDHPFMTTEGFIRIKDITSDTRLIMADGDVDSVFYCYPEDYSGKVFSLDLVRSSTFTCQGFLSGTGKIQGDVKLVIGEVEDKEQAINLSATLFAEINKAQQLMKGWCK